MLKLVKDRWGFASDMNEPYVVILNINPEGIEYE